MNKYFYLTCNDERWPDHPFILWETTRNGYGEPARGVLQNWHTFEYKFITNKGINALRPRGSDYISNEKRY